MAKIPWHTEKYIFLPIWPKKMSTISIHSHWRAIVVLAVVIFFFIWQSKGNEVSAPDLNRRVWRVLEILLAHRLKVSEPEYVCCSDQGTSGIGVLGGREERRRLWQAHLVASPISTSPFVLTHSRPSLRQQSRLLQLNCSDRVPCLPFSSWAGGATWPLGHGDLNGSQLVVTSGKVFAFKIRGTNMDGTTLPPSSCLEGRHSSPPGQRSFQRERPRNTGASALALL